jgi:uncharacterized protein YbjQ (UPF0145 family)
MTFMPSTIQRIEGRSVVAVAREACRLHVGVSTSSPRQALGMSNIIVSTMNDLPGYDVVEVHGEVYGLIVRARNVFSNIGAGLRTVVGGEAKGYTKLLSDSRDQATERLREAATAKGANAVLAMRFDCNEIGDIMSEVAAYGTAVTVRPRS